MIAKTASGQYSAHPSTRVCTMEALVLKRSSLVIPGFLGTPAGITTTSHPVKASPSPSFPTGGHFPGLGKVPIVFDLVGIYQFSAKEIDFNHVSFIIQ